MSSFRQILLALSRIHPGWMLVGIAGISFCVSYAINLRLAEIDRASSSARNEMLKEANRTTRVLYAVKDVPEGGRLASDAVEEKEIPAQRAPQDAIPASSMAVGKFAKYGITAGQLISQHDIATIAPVTGFESRLRDGLRAVTFGVDNNSGVAGFVSPESRIDIYALVGSAGDTKASPVLSDVEVVAAGQIFQKSPGAPNPVPTSSFTVAVTPEDAQKLMKAISASKLYVALRNPNDHMPVATVDVSSMFNKVSSNGTPIASMPTPPPLPLPSILDEQGLSQKGEAAKAPLRLHEIEVWTGSKKDVVSFGGS